MECVIKAKQKMIQLLDEKKGLAWLTVRSVCFHLFNDSFIFPFDKKTAVQPLCLFFQSVTQFLLM